MDKKNKGWQKIPFKKISIEDNFWCPRIEKNRKISLYHQFRQFEKTGAFKNFKNVIKKKCTAYSGLFFSDADVYKWIEAASYSLLSFPDSKLEKLVERAVSLIENAQEASGYINTYFQLVEPDKKFTNFGACHELYCAGHLINAGIAHFSATGKKTLLNVALRFVNYIDNIFGTGKLEAIDGHAGIETALMDLYRLTGESRSLKLALFFINERGKKNSRLRWECGHLDEIGGELGKPGKKNLKYYKSFKDYDGRYAQDHLPVRCQTKVVGHAVRAMYLYCGMADIAIETGEQELITTLNNLWNHLTTRRMYITGGIGPARANEGFTDDYDLPNDTVCAETCAAVGMILWNHRLLHITGESRFADIIERVLYNGFLVSVSLDGKKYFYNNPLQSNGTEHREYWYECACCPPNAARLFATLGDYIYSHVSDGVAVHLFIQSSVQWNINSREVVICQETNYPWDGKIQFSFKNKKPVYFSFYIRIPGWCNNYTLMINQKKAVIQIEKGYVKITKEWKFNDNIILNLDMPVQQISAHPCVKQNFRKVALQRGPLIYCLEDADNDIPVEQIVLYNNTDIHCKYISDLLGGIVLLEGNALAPDMSCWNQVLYQKENKDKQLTEIQFKAVPYYTWDNRTGGSMIVWINKS